MDELFLLAVLLVLAGVGLRPFAVSPFKGNRSEVPSKLGAWSGFRLIIPRHSTAGRQTERPGGSPSGLIRPGLSARDDANHSVHPSA